MSQLLNLFGKLHHGCLWVLQPVNWQSGQETAVNNLYTPNPTPSSSQKLNSSGSQTREMTRRQLAVPCLSTY